MNPIQQPIQTPPEVTILQPKPNYLKTIIFSVLIIITLSLIAYLVFQNQKLQKQVLNPPVSPTIQPISSTPTSKLISSISDSTDATINWLAYTNSNINFSFRYPLTWSKKENNPTIDNSNIAIFTHSEYGEIIIQKGVFADGIDKPEIKFVYKSISLNEKDIKVQEIYLNNLLTQRTYEILNGNETILLLFIPKTPNDFKIFDQILSTFKFTDKQCPEGQYARQCKRGPCCCPVGAICD